MTYNNDGVKKKGKLFNSNGILKFQKINKFPNKRISNTIDSILTVANGEGNMFCIEKSEIENILDLNGNYLGWRISFDDSIQKVTFDKVHANGSPDGNPVALDDYQYELFYYDNPVPGQTISKDVFFNPITVFLEVNGNVVSETKEIDFYFLNASELELLDLTTVTKFCFSMSVINLGSIFASNLSQNLTVPSLKLETLSIVDNEVLGEYPTYPSFPTVVMIPPCPPIWKPGFSYIKN